MTDDRCGKLLCSSRRFAGEGRAVVVLEDSASVEAYGPFLAAPECVFLARRWEVCQAFSAHARHVRFCDAGLSKFGDDSVGAVYLRVAKEKALVHHVINHARRILRPDGTLHLAGMRQEGTKTYVEKAALLLGGETRVKTTVSGARCGVLSKRAGAAPPSLPDQDYQRVRRIEFGEGGALYSKPGVFGWRKEDPGSALLIANVPVPRSCSVLDLGCGYGYLAVKAWEAGAGEVWATDNSAAALAACHQNFDAYSIRGKVLPGWCGDQISRRFALILCNPPFHHGFKVNGKLGVEFLGAMARLLEPSGRAYVVVNSFIPLEKCTTEFFANSESVVDNGRFKVLCVTGPRQA